MKQTVGATQAIASQLLKSLDLPNDITTKLAKVANMPKFAVILPTYRLKLSESTYINFI